MHGEPPEGDRIRRNIDGGRERGKESDKVRQSEREGIRQRDGCGRVAKVRRCCDD